MRVWNFGLTLNSLMARLKELKLPSSRTAIKYWEQIGLIRFYRRPGGWIYFKDREEIEQFANKIRLVFPHHDRGSDDFSVKPSGTVNISEKE